MLTSKVDTTVTQVFLDPLVSAIISICLLSYLLWRIWNFTVMPWLRPDEPMPLPYWVPFLVILTIS